MKGKLMPMIYANDCPFGCYVSNSEYLCEHNENKTGKCWTGNDAWKLSCEPSKFPPQCPLIDCEVENED